MKVIIVSDIHGNFNNMKKVLQNENSFDKLIILGDILEGPYSNKEQLINLLNIYKDKIIAVRGNCDYDISSFDFSVDKLFLLVPIDNKKIFLTHGHYYNINNIPVDDYDVYIQGHRHIPMMEEKNNKVYLNPGSISLPRGGSNKSYIVYENNNFYLKDLEENEIIKSISQ